MTTGDLKNNMQKLKSELKALRVEKDVDFEGISKGLSQAFLPIYHYAFIDYSQAVAQQIADLGCVLENKSDLRFLEGMYKVLRELFSYKPLVNKEQFFSPGFVERKVIMATDVLTRVRMLGKSLAPKMTARSAPRHPAAARSVPVNRALSERTVMARSQSPLTKEGRNTPTHSSTPDTARNSQRPWPPNLPCVFPTRLHGDCIHGDPASSPPSPQHSISPPIIQPSCVYRTQYKPQCYSEIDTIQVAESDGSKSPSPLRTFSLPPSGGSENRSMSPHTYSNGFVAAEDVRLQTSPSDISIHDGGDQPSSVLTSKEVAVMLQNVRELNTRVTDLEQTVALLLKSRCTAEEGTESIGTSGSIENMAARLTLLENRLTDCEAKTPCDDVPAPSMMKADSYSTCHVSTQAMLQCSGDCELSPRKEEIVAASQPRRSDLAEGDYATISMAVPTTSKVVATEMAPYEGHITSSGQAVRISNLLKQTEELLEKKPLQREMDAPIDLPSEPCN